MSYIVSPNMNLSIPTVGVEPGPTYAQDINNSLTAIDQHNHTAGQGVQITPSGLNINADLTFNNFNATEFRSIRFQSQTSLLALSTDLGCLYESGVDLYYNDGLGNQVRITQSGGIAGSPGSISGLVSPASATYVSGSQTFVWESDASTPANMDAGAYIFRNLTPSSFGITVQAPASLSSDYTIVLPGLPSVTSVLTIDASGNMGTKTYDQVGQNMTATGANAIAATMTSTGTDSIIATMGAAGANSIANNRTRATGTTVAAGGVAISNSSGTFSVTGMGTSYVSVTNLSVTITTTGRPVMVMLQPDGNGSGNLSRIGTNTSSAFKVRFVSSTGTTAATFLPASVFFPPASQSFVEAVAAGTYTYTFQIGLASGTDTDAGYVEYAKLVAYEL